MSIVSEIMSAIRSAILTAYPTKLELVNREDLAMNPDHILGNGFDVLIGSATNEGEMGGRGNSFQRNISVILSKRVVDSDLQNDSKHDTEKILLDEMIAIASLLKTNQPVVQKVLNLECVGDAGISVTNAEKVKFISTQLDFNIKYVEFYN